MVCLNDPLVQHISHLYHKLASLDSLSPSPTVNSLFSQLVSACIPPHPIDLPSLSPEIHHLRSNLISLCSTAESLLERHHSSALALLPDPLHHLHLFPYYSNYLSLSRLEFDLLIPHTPLPHRLAFVGSGPLPLSSILLALHHLPSAVFDNFDIDESANSMAARLVEQHPDVSCRMNFCTSDIVDVDGSVIRGYDVVFLAALVGVEVEEKMRVIEHLERSMAPGAILVVRSAHGARAFLYPVVEPRSLRGFEVLSVYHPTDDVINSVVVARKVAPAAGGIAAAMRCSKCGEVGKLVNLQVEGLAVEDHIC